MIEPTATQRLRRRPSIWIPLKINAEDTARGHWFASHIVDGKSIPLIDHAANPIGDFLDMIPLNVYFVEDLHQLQDQGPLSHPDATYFYRHETKQYTAGDLRQCSFTSDFVYGLTARYTGHVCTAMRCDISLEDQSNLLKGIQNGSVSLAFNVAADTRAKPGETARVAYQWDISQGYDVFVINWDDADPSVDPSFTESETGLSTARWKVMVIDGKLVSIVASPTIDKIAKDVEYAWLVLAGLAAVINGQDVASGKDAPFSPYASPYRALGRYACGLARGAVSLPILAHMAIVSRQTVPTPISALTPAATRTCVPEAPLGILPSPLSVIKTDSFDDPTRTDWQIDPDVGIIRKGCLIIVGRDWGGATYDKELSAGYGVLLNFQYYSHGSYFQMFLDNGEWQADAYKRFGVFVVNDHLETNIYQGKTGTATPITGDLALSPGTWYSLLLAIGKGGGFLARTWNPASPGQVTQYAMTFGPGWSGLRWTFHISANSGTIFFDNSREVAIPIN